MAGSAFSVGDYARSLESGWLGKIVEIDGKGMAKLIGVDWVAYTIMDESLDDSLCPDDVRWFALDDLVSVRQGLSDA